MTFLLLGAGRTASAAGGGGAWTPASLGAALRAWYQADLLTGSNGDPQGSIADSSGNGFGLSASGSLRATLAAADLNSKNTLRFTASNSQRYNLTSSVFSGASAASVYAVYKVVSTSANNGWMNIGSGGSTSFPFSNGLYYNDFATTVRKDGMSPTASSSSAYRIISIYSAASDWAFYMDGGTGGSSGGTSPVFQTSTNTVGFSGAQQHIGVNSGLIGLDGWFAEIVLTNAKDADRQKAEGYLAHKWFGAGASNNLDSTHPYKSTPP